MGFICEATGHVTKTRACPVHPKPSPYNAQHQRTSLTLRQRWVAANGPKCPGYLIPAHWVGSISDLCADHLISGDASAGYQVLCVSCNSRRRNDR